MQVHHGFDEQRVRAQVVYDGVGEATKVEFAVIASNEVPAFRLDFDASQCCFELLEQLFLGWAHGAVLTFDTPDRFTGGTTRVRRGQMAGT